MKVQVWRSVSTMGADMAREPIPSAMTITLPQQNIKMDVPTGIDPVWYGKLQALIKEVNLLSGITPPAGATPITASLGADVLLNATGSYFTGPQIAQGTVGTWFASGTVSVLDTAGAANMRAKQAVGRYDCYCQWYGNLSGSKSTARDIPKRIYSVPCQQSADLGQGYHLGLLD